MKVIFRGGDGHPRVMPPAWETLAAEFPAVRLRAGPGDGGTPFLPSLHLTEWESHSFSFYDFDACLDASAEGPFTIVLAAEEEELPGFARQVLTRCQRLMDRRNTESRSAQFDRVLAEHRAMHDLTKPLVRADFNHALDTWHWTLRLEPEAGLAVQLAALFHDVERLESEAEARSEQHAADYQAFKDAHARRGAEMADEVLTRADMDRETRQRVAELIVGHEQRQGSADVALLNDADALSFFSLNSAGYLDYYGPEQTRRKVAYTLARLRPEARRHLAGMRLPPLVSEAAAEDLAVPEQVA